MRLRVGSYKYGLRIPGASFTLVAWTPCPADAVVIRYAESEGPSEEVLQKGREAWDAANQKREAAGLPAMTPNPLYRPLDQKREGNQMIVTAGVTSYFENFALERFGGLREVLPLAGAGLSIVPVTSDRQVLLGQRSQVVASEVSKYHVVGGHAHPSEDFPTKPAQFQPFIWEELEEEMGIVEADLVPRGLAYLGMAMDATRGKPEYLFMAQLRLSRDEVIARWKQDQAAQRAQGTEASMEFTRLTTLQELMQAQAGGAEIPDGFDWSIDQLMSLSDMLVPACQAALVARWLLEEGNSEEEFKTSS